MKEPIGEMDSGFNPVFKQYNHQIDIMELRGMLILCENSSFICHHRFDPPLKRSIRIQLHQEILGLFSSWLVEDCEGPRGYQVFVRENSLDNIDNRS
jgi:hypothetical protein